MSITTIESKKTALTEQWKELLQSRPNLRIRDAAAAIGVSEAELLATKTGGDVIRLQGPWPDLLVGFKNLKHVMVLTRNEACVLEHKGPFQKIDIVGSGAHSMATVIGPIESRVFFQSWHIAFAVREEKSDRVLKSIQIFDKAGEAIMKVYVQDKSNEAAYKEIVETFRAPEQSADLGLTPWKEETYNENPDTEAFLNEWAELKDTHDFFGMLRRHKVHRYRAIELANGRFTYPVDAQQSPQKILDEAAATKLPIMIFAGNRGHIQIHQGKVRTIRVFERGENECQRWLNVLDPEFNMHLRMDLVDKAWVVKKPTSEGDVTSVELFDKERNLVAQFFGLRKPGIPEREAWRALVDSLGTVNS